MASYKLKGNFIVSFQEWLIVQEVLKSIGSAHAKKIASRLKIPDVKIFLDYIKILVLSDTFELDYSYVISEIQTNEKLKSFMELKYVPEVEYIYKYFSQLYYKCLNTFFRNVFKIVPNMHKKGRKYVIIDTTAIPIDINTWRKRFEIGKDKKYIWSYSSSDGYYVGYKLILESKKLRRGDFILCDRGFTAMKNYHILISRFLLVPMIFARKNADIKRILSILTPPLDVWNGKPYLLGIWKKIIKEFVEILEIWPVFRELRSNIELFFSVAKNCVRLNKVHQLTKESVLKKIIRAFHLTSELIKTAKLFNIGVRELAET